MIESTTTFVEKTILTSPESILAFPILSILLLILPIASGLILLISDQLKARYIALFASIITLLVSLFVVFNFDASNPGFQFIESVPWITSLNVEYTVGVDGISILFLPLTSLLFIGVIIASWTSIQSMPKVFYVLILLLETATIGIFVSLNTILFFFFWEITLLPIYFLINFWGVGPNRRYAAVKYTLVMMAGGMPLLLGFILLAFNHASTGSGELVFDIIQLLNNPLPAEYQTTIFF
ncbi:MAG: NADH-quinone oxidoreductase subunit M, partial [Proteobacteria bacterium]|nr:NADH-quinone oxidoreductase subunit M [Pseudomonadota bacterium]